MAPCNDHDPRDDAEQDVGVVVVPYQSLSEEALDGILGEFVSREGTDYGDYDVSFEQKKQQVLNQLRSGKAQLFFDPQSSSCHLAPFD